MGIPIARNLKNAGASVSVYNRSPQKLDSLSNEGFTRLESPGHACGAQIVICMVSDTAAVEQVIFGDNGIAANAVAGTIFVDMGTTEVNATREFARRLSALKVKYIDAPVSGGEIGAIEGTLSIMVGASRSDMNTVKPIFNVLGSNVMHVGDVGCGQIAKAANQIIVGLTIEAVAEAFALCRDGGADLNKVWEALRGGFADSRILQTHGKRMINGEFTPGGKAVTQHKDLQQALHFAKTNQTELPATELCRDRYQNLIDSGDGALDHSALYRLY